MDHAGLPLKTVLNQLELLGGEVIPVLRKEIEAQAGPGDGPGADPRALVKAKYGDQPPRQPRPNANRGDNVTGASPYQDTEDSSRPSTRRRSKAVRWQYADVPGDACSRHGGHRAPPVDPPGTQSGIPPTTRGRRCCPRTRR